MPYGPNHTLNPTCDAGGTDYWHLGATGSGSAYANGRIEFDNFGGGPIAWQGINDLTPGSTYLLSGDCSIAEGEEGRGGEMLVQFGGAGLDQIHVLPGDNSFSIQFTATGIGGTVLSTGLKFTQIGGTDIYGWLDNIQLREVLADNDSLVPSDISGFAPSIGLVAIAQLQALNVTGVATSAPAIASPALVQAHVLAPSALSTAAPQIATVAATLRFDLVPQGVTLGVPEVSTPAALINSAVAPSDLTGVPPVLSAVALTQNHPFDLSGAVTTSPSSGMSQGSLVQCHALTPAAIVSASPAVAASSVFQSHAIASAGLQLAAPVLATVAVLINVAAVPLALTTAAPDLRSVAMVQGYGLVPLDLLTASPSITGVALSQTHQLEPSPVSSIAVVILAAAPAQQHVLTPTGLSTFAPVLSPASLVQLSALTPTNVVTAAPLVSVATALINIVVTPLPASTAAAEISAAGPLWQVHVLTAGNIATPPVEVTALTVRRWMLAGNARTSYSEVQVRRSVSQEITVPHLWPNKDPDEVLDYDHDHGPRLAGDEIVSADSFVEEGDVVIEDFDFFGTVQKTWLSGGTEGTKCRIGMRIVTSNGRTMDESAVFRIKSR